MSRQIAKVIKSQWFRYRLGSLVDANPVIVLQMGKVGSSAVVRTLQQCCPDEVVIHTHSVRKHDTERRCLVGDARGKPLADRASRETIPSRRQSPSGLVRCLPKHRRFGLGRLRDLADGDVGHRYASRVDAAGIFQCPDGCQDDVGRIARRIRMNPVIHYSNRRSWQH